MLIFLDSSNGYHPARPKTLKKQTVSDNERLLLDIIRKKDSVTRADLTRYTGLTAQSISRLISGLINRKLITFGEKIIQGRGQPGAKIHLVDDVLFSIGVSIMTDDVTAVLMNFAGDILAERETPLHSTDREYIFSAIKKLVDSFTNSHIKDKSKIIGVGVAISGYFTGVNHQVNAPDPLGSISKFDVDQALAEHLCLPIWIENNARAAAVGECLTGVGQHCRSFAYLSHDKGFGGAIVLNNELMRGHVGNAGEFSGILAPDKLDVRPTIELLRLKINAHGKSFANIKELVDKFDINLPGVEEWIKEVARPLSQVITSISAVIDPEYIVVGGGRMPTCLANELLTKVQYFDGPLRRGINQPRPKIVLSEVKGDATAIGAASIPLKNSYFV